MKYAEFDVVKALAGEPVILRAGSKAYVRHHETELEVNYPLLGYDEGGCTRTWSAVGESVQGMNSHGDIIGMLPKEPLTMPDSFWGMLTSEIVAIAKDEDGYWNGFEGIPMLHDKGFWVDGSSRYHLEAYPQEIFPDCEPKDSLILRPSK